MSDRDEGLVSLLKPAAGAFVGWHAGRALAGVLSWMAWIGVIGALMLWLFTGSASGALLLTMFFFGLVVLILFAILRVLNKAVMGDD